MLWQPHANVLLYPTVATGKVTLFLQGLGGAVKAVGTVPTLVDMAFSPDGKSLLVRTPQDFQLWPIGGTSQPTWHVPEADPLALPWWSPDGTKIAFMTSPMNDLVRGVGHYEVYTVNVNGTGVRNITGSAGISEAAPAWK